MPRQSWLTAALVQADASRSTPKHPASCGAAEPSTRHVAFPSPLSRTFVAARAGLPSNVCRDRPRNSGRQPRSRLRRATSKPAFVGRVTGLYEHAGGKRRCTLEELVYSKVLADPVLRWLFMERRPSSASGRRCARISAHGAGRGRRSGGLVVRGASIRLRHNIGLTPIRLPASNGAASPSSAASEVSATRQWALAGGAWAGVAALSIKAVAAAVKTSSA
jgi:hypothetical protein